MNGNGYPFVTYDCFTDTRFGGNLGAIVFDAGGLTDAQMQSVAREMNAPVTGFVTGRLDNAVSARFFMPTTEIAMCGHVTIGLFTHLADRVAGTRQDFTLKVQAGDISVSVETDAKGQATAMMALDLPKPLELAPDIEELAAALNVPTVTLSQGPAISGADAGLRHLFVPVPALDDLRALAPDFVSLGAFSEALGVHTIACFAMTPDDPGKTLEIRDFCPAVGVNETPASGTTNGALTGYLLSTGLIEPTDQRLVAAQGRNIDRPSVIVSDIEVTCGAIASLKTGGQAVRSFSGVIEPF